MTVDKAWRETWNESSVGECLVHILTAYPYYHARFLPLLVEFLAQNNKRLQFLARSAVILAVI